MYNYADQLRSKKKKVKSKKQPKKGFGKFIYIGIFALLLVYIVIKKLPSQPSQKIEQEQELLVSNQNLRTFASLINTNKKHRYLIPSFQDMERSYRKAKEYNLNISYIEDVGTKELLTQYKRGNIRVVENGIHKINRALKKKIKKYEKSKAN